MRHMASSAPATGGVKLTVCGRWITLDPGHLSPADTTPSWAEVDCLECLTANGITLPELPDRTDPTSIDAWLDA